MEPLRFSPYLRPMVWGGRQLQHLGKLLTADTAYGESWEVSDHPSHLTVIRTGPLAGKTLRFLMEERRRELLGPAHNTYTVFPWLVKFLDAHDWLSVQVHPDESAVKHLWPGEGSKTEAWFILDVQPGAKIFAGLKDGVNEVELRQASLNGTVADCLHSFEPKPGDCVFLPAGTVHALGGGILLVEVQQTSDATFRLFDWNRKDDQGKSRQLHLEQALASIHWNNPPVRPVAVPGFGKEIRNHLEVPLVKCRYFEMNYVQSRNPISLDADRLRSVIVVAGQAALETPAGSESTAKGDVWVVPASARKVTCRPKDGVGLLICTLP